MSWHYRILRHRDGALALHEVYCNEAGQPNGYTEQPMGFAMDADEGADALRQALRRALNDATNRPILDVADLGGSTEESEKV